MSAPGFLRFITALLLCAWVVMGIRHHAGELAAAWRLRRLVEESNRQWAILGSADRLRRAVRLLEEMRPGLKEYDVPSHDFSLIAGRLRMLIEMGGVGVYDGRGNFFLRGDVLVHAGSAGGVLALSKVLLHEGTHNVDSLQPGWGGEYYRDPVKNALSELNALRNEAVWLDNLHSAFGSSPRWKYILESCPSTRDVLYGVDGIAGYGQSGMRGVVEVFRYRIFLRPAYDWQYYGKKVDLDGARTALKEIGR
jgi:hypothetical protein